MLNPIILRGYERRRGTILKRIGGVSSPSDKTSHKLEICSEFIFESQFQQDEELL